MDSKKRNVDFRAIYGVENDFSAETRRQDIPRYGMSEDEYNDYLATREETLELCNSFLAFYNDNPQFQLDL